RRSTAPHRDWLHRRQARTRSRWERRTTGHRGSAPRLVPGLAVQELFGRRSSWWRLFDNGAPPRQDEGQQTSAEALILTTLLVSQPNFADHRTPQGHAERADRIRAVEEALARPRFDRLLRRPAPSSDLMLA